MFADQSAICGANRTTEIIRHLSATSHTLGFEYHCMYIYVYARVWVHNGTDVDQSMPSRDSLIAWKNIIWRPAGC